MAIALTSADTRPQSSLMATTTVVSSPRPNPPLLPPPTIAYSVVNSTRLLRLVYVGNARNIVLVVDMNFAAQSAVPATR